MKLPALANHKWNGRNPLLQEIPCQIAGGIVAIPGTPAKKVSNRSEFFFDFWNEIEASNRNGKRRSVCGMAGEGIHDASPKQNAFVTHHVKLHHTRPIVSPNRAPHIFGQKCGPFMRPVSSFRTRQRGTANAPTALVSQRRDTPCRSPRCARPRPSCWQR